MHEEICPFDYAVIRLVPRVEREEFFNVGVIVSCPSQQFLDARIYLSEEKLKAFAPALDAETARKYLEIIPKICAGDRAAGVIGRLKPRERFYWLTAQRSTIVQTSPVHTGFCTDAAEMLQRLFDKMVG
ncbi:MAG TPA: DUF3037 domain-containing protein [Pyrinomonadaceae bacterium]|nr:DUF3037 domain-containing protein [Pyrinomonadaceae bacterium]